MYKEKFDINSSIFASLRDQFNVMLNCLIQEANTTGKEGELTVKLKVDTATQRNYATGSVTEEWTEPRLSWTVARKIKESKFDTKSSSGTGYKLEFDIDGKPYLRDISDKQITFDDFLDSQYEARQPEEQEDEADGIESSEETEDCTPDEECSAGDESSENDAEE